MVLDLVNIAKLLLSLKVLIDLSTVGVFVICLAALILCSAFISG